MNPDTHLVSAKAELRPLHSFQPGQLKFSYQPSIGAYVHNFERDLQMFVLWETSQEHWPEILADLEQRFRVLDVRHVSWPAQDVDNNFRRLYWMPPAASSDDAQGFKRRQICGSGTFALVVVEDTAPAYGYARTFSQKVELVNRSIVAAKTLYREWTGGGFRIHSSNSLGEFFRDMSLLVGTVELDRLLDLHDPFCGTPNAVSTKLAGTSGWASLTELFTHLLRSVDYAVLRNFEELPDRLPDGDADVDALCRSAQDLAAVANARVLVDQCGKFSCVTQVNNSPLQFDLRTIGDNYYDTQWQADMLARAQVHGGCVMTLALDDYFFSLLYHAKVHKRQTKEIYRERLTQIASALGLAQLPGADLTADEAAAELLAGFLVANGYAYAAPLDIWVQLNKPFVRRLRAQGALWKNESMRDRLIVSAALTRTPLLWRVHRQLTVPVTQAMRFLRKLAYR